jgi:hypothetical protein
MSRCKLGLRKHRQCEQITGKKYDICLVRGNSAHYVAHCCYTIDGIQYIDYVNYATGEFEEKADQSKYN